MDCILKVIKGPDTGASCKLQPGTNLVGRSMKAALKLTPSDISWEHLSVDRNGDQCTASNLSASGSYLDDARLTGPVKLRSRDQIRLSKETLLRFESAGGDEAGRRGWMLLVLLLMGAVGLVVWAIGVGDQTSNWDAAYLKVDNWSNDQAKMKRMPAELPRLFENAWRLEQVQDYAGSRPAWLRARMLLDTISDRYALPTQTAEHPNALQSLLTPPSGPQPDPTDEELAAAFSQFINRRLSWSTAQLASK